jgi:hypothetical protein
LRISFNNLSARRASLFEPFGIQEGGYRPTERLGLPAVLDQTKALVGLVRLLARLALLNSVRHWLDRAEEARAVAGQINDPEARRVMLGIAEGYERMAKLAEERNARNAAGQVNGTKSRQS